EPPRRSPPEPPPPSRTSATSDWARSVTSLAIFASAPPATAQAAATSTMRDRSVCQGSTGTARSSSPASSLATAGPPGPTAPSAPGRPRRAAELHGQALCPPPRHGIARLVQAGQPAGRDQAEGDGDGLLQQRAADHYGVPVGRSQPGAALGGGGQVHRDRVQ